MGDNKIKLLFYFFMVSHWVLLKRLKKKFKFLIADEVLSLGDNRLHAIFIGDALLKLK